MLNVKPCSKITIPTIHAHFTVRRMNQLYMKPVMHDVCNKIPYMKPAIICDLGKKEKLV